MNKQSTIQNTQIRTIKETTAIVCVKDEAEGVDTGTFGGLSKGVYFKQDIPQEFCFCVIKFLVCPRMNSKSCLRGTIKKHKSFIVHVY